MAHFDETSGVVACETSFGRWWQTIEELFIEIPSKELVTAKQVKCIIKPNRIECSIKGEVVIQGNLYQTIQADESTWTLEESKFVRILLAKSTKDAGNCWPSLLADGQYSADPYLLDSMQKKLTLERFQRDNPGMDFSGAEISGNYQSGGPRLPL